MHHPVRHDRDPEGFFERTLKNPFACTHIVIISNLCYHKPHTPDDTVFEAQVGWSYAAKPDSFEMLHCFRDLQ